ncbi:MAG TPA: hypothetical protein VFI74_01790 [Candidatus Saccharimonadales bacterium]|nr:hypothetical protein [Candidatus Saccharimonadales bacterium]
MYSGTTLTPLSGRILGAHQKIDRLARSVLRLSAPESIHVFPTTRAILKFEGLNGPDAIKRKSPARDEPWHYYAPFDPDDTQLIDIIEAHHRKLAAALKDKDTIRASFEAAWLAHAIVDGLTPAHHYPYEEELTELRGGEGIEHRTTIRKKLVMPGENRREQMRNNWKMWGPKGLLTTHGLFEWGIAAIIAPLTVRGSRTKLSESDIHELAEHGLTELFKRKAREVAALEMYDAYYKNGWTPKLASQVKRQLVPIIVQTVALAWYSALQTSGVVPAPKKVSQ